MGFFSSTLTKLDLGLQWVNRIRAIEKKWSEGNILGAMGDAISIFRQQTSNAFESKESVLTDEEAKLYEKAVGIVSGTKEKGIRYLHTRIDASIASMDKMSQEVSAMKFLIDQRFQIVIEQFKMSILLQQDMVRLLKMSDSEKVRIESMREGVKFLKHAPSDDRHYTDALFYFEKAISLKPTDYFPHQCMGHIYLFSSKKFNILKAEEHFEKAAAYAAVELDEIKLAQTSGSPAPEENLNIVRSPQLDATSSYYHAALCCFLQKKYLSAKPLIGKVLTFDKTHLDALLLQAKICFALDEEKEGVAIVTKGLNTDLLFSLKLLADPLLCAEPLVVQLLEQTKDETFKNTLKHIDSVESSMMSGSLAHNKMQTIKRGIVSENSLLEIEQMRSIFLEQREWKFHQTGGPEISVIDHLFSHSLSRIELRLLRDATKQTIDTINATIRKYYDTLPYVIAPIGHPITTPEFNNWKKSISPKSLNCSISDFVTHEKHIYNASQNLLAELN